MIEPSWSLQIGEQCLNGAGVLGVRRPPDDLIDLFSVTMNGTQVIVLPKKGKIVQNLKTLWDGARGKLIWFRRMRIEFGNGAPKRDCVCYGIGIQVGDKRIGYRLYVDGRLEEGLN